MPLSKIKGNVPDLSLSCASVRENGKQIDSGQIIHDVLTNVMKNNELNSVV
ncbi:MAG: hypothetical protein AAFZ89_14755 [Bacteroidota bacterium]